MIVEKTLCFLLLLSLFLNVEVSAYLKPPKSNKVLSARWLISSVNWGVLGTTRGNGEVFTNVVSLSDGIGSQLERKNATGIPFFYLTKLDETARDLTHHSVASLTVSEKSADVDGRCGATDAEDPPCARLTLRGKVRPVLSTKRRQFARSALFSKHPAMKQWEHAHEFDFYEMEIEEIFFLNNYGGASPISVHEYLGAKLSNKMDTVAKE